MPVFSLEPLPELGRSFFNRRIGRDRHFSDVTKHGFLDSIASVRNQKMLE